MAANDLSLISYLTKPNPIVSSGKSWPGNNTASRRNTYLEPNAIMDWADFNHETLQAMYGETLKIKIRGQKLPDFGGHFPFHFIEIQDEDSLEALLIRWNNAVVSCALSVAQNDPHLRASSDLGDVSNEIYMARGGHAHIPQTEKKKGLRPDWAGIIRSLVQPTSNEHQSHKNVLPGDTKLSTKWSSTKWKSSQESQDVEFKKPLCQLLTYCERAQVRYGYILTQEELVAIRISVRPGTKAPATQTSRPGLPRSCNVQTKMEMEFSTANVGSATAHRIVEFKSVPWENGGEAGEDQLSINLALWWLHMMAARERSIASEYDDLCKEYQITHRDHMEPSGKVRKKTGDKKNRVGTTKKRQRNELSESDDSMDDRLEESKTKPRRKAARSFGGPMQLD